ncbi:MAG TPA: PASTA domain-containing protein [Gaiellaceae bacterium]|nr:PASTA domain-containing protein [Gaiellaceae bacterium]
MRYALVVVLVCTLAALAVAGNGASGATQAVIPAPGNQESPGIAFTGASYLVGWKDTRTESTRSVRALRPQLPPPPPPPPPPPRADVFGARVSRAGRVLDAGGITIEREAYQRLGPALASDGTNALVVWTDRQGTTTPGVIYGARITRAGTVLDRPGISIYNGQGEQASPAVAFDGANYLVVWQNIAWPVLGWFLDAARVTPSGTVLDPAAIRISNGYAASPAVASGGTNSLVVWLGAGGSVVGARISPSGAVLDPNPITISCPSNYSCTSIYPNEPVIAFDGTNYLVAWSDSGSGNIYGTRISLAGTVLDPGGIRISDGVRTGKPTIAFGGANYLVAWQDARFGCCSIYGTRVSPAGSVLDPAGIAIATRGREQVEPTAAFDGTNYFVAWADRRSVVASGSDIYGAHVTQDGRVLEARGILLSTVVRRTPRQAPCIVPRVIGQRLATARARIRRAHCSVGRIRRVRSLRRRGRVISQSPRPEARRSRGARVNLAVGRR